MPTLIMTFSHPVVNWPPIRLDIADDSIEDIDALVNGILAERPTDGGRTDYRTTPADNERDLGRFMMKVEALILAATEGALSGESPLADDLALLDQAKDLVGPCTGYARALGWDEKRIISFRCSLLGAIGAATRTVRRAHARR